MLLLFVSLEFVVLRRIFFVLIRTFSVAQLHLLCHFVLFCFQLVLISCRFTFMYGILARISSWYMSFVDGQLVYTFQLYLVVVHCSTLLPARTMIL